MEDAPPQSQVPLDVPPIFRNPDGSQWSVFVQTDGMPERLKLVRKLRKAEAMISTDPKQARVIIVYANSDQGRQFIRDWVEDSNKAVLNPAWVQASITAGKVLGEEDNWGGYIAVDDGAPIQDRDGDDGDDTVRRNPPNVQPAAKQNIIAPEPQLAQAELTRQPPANDTTQATLNSPASQPVSQNTEQISLQQASQAQAGGMPQTPISNAVSFDLSGLLASQHNMSQAPGQIQPGMVVQLPPQLLAAMQQQFAMAANNILLNAGMIPASSLYASQPGPWTLPSAPSAPNQQSTASGATGQQTYELHAPPSNFIPNGATTSQPRSSSDVQSSLGRKSPVISRTVHKSEMSTLSTGSPSTSRASSTPHPPLSAAKSSSPRSSIFRADSGEELLFFADTDISGRNKLVGAIKKNGGKMTGEFSSADYIVLASHTKDFKYYRKIVDSTGKIAVRPAFIYDSVEQNVLLNPSDYSVGSGKRKRFSTSEGHRESPAKRRAGGKKTSTQKERDISEVNENPQPTRDREGTRSRSPTPPPEDTRVPYGESGHYRYPEEERSYVTRYLNFLFKKDHQMGSSAIAQRLYQKMPHHSVKSWGTFLTSTISGEVESLRKKAGIAYRKERYNRSLDAPPSQEAPQSARTTASSSTSMAQQDTSDDLEVIARYFAFDGGDSSEERDDVIWARLTEKRKCKTAGSWEEFYNMHHVEVLARYAKFLDSEPT